MTEHADLLAWIDSQRETLIERTRTWAEINSSSENLAGLGHMLEELAEAFAPLGGEQERVDLPPMEAVGEDGVPATRSLGRMLRIVRRPSANRRILLVGHMDTVYPAESAFQTCRLLDDHILQGPGVADMKGGIAVMLTVLGALERSPRAEEVGWEVLLTPDEEVGSAGSMPHLEAAAERAHIGLIFEPALPDGTLVGARKGSGGYTAVVRGRTAHAGRDPEQGRNAVVALAALVTALDELNGRRPGLTLNVGKIRGGGPSNVVPDLAVCEVDIRVPSPEDQEWVEAEVAKRVAEIDRQDGVSVELHGGFSRPPKGMTPELRHLFDLLEHCGEQLGLPVPHRSTGGCCDGNNLAAAGLATIDTLGVHGGELHSEREFVRLDSLTERAKLAALFLLQLTSGEVEWPVPATS